MARRLSTGIAAAWLILAGPPFALAQQAPRNFIALEAPRPIAAIAFEDDRGRARSIGDFKGKVVLLNIWATWCGPCREEMPALDRLQALLGGPDFEVVALSLDREGRELGRIAGPAEWDSTESAGFLQSVMSGQHSVVASGGRDDEIEGAKTAHDSQGVLGRGLHWLRALLGR